MKNYRSVIARVVMTLVAILICMPLSAFTQADVDKALKTLDNEIKKRSVYIDAKAHSIDSLRVLADRSTSDSARLIYLMSIADKYNSFLNDSALYVYTRGYDLALADGDSINAVKFRLKRASALPLSGFEASAVNEFLDIDVSLLPDSLLPIYHESGQRMYSYISDLYINHPDTRQYWAALAVDHQKQLAALYPEDSPAYLFNMGQALFADGEYVRAEKMLTKLLGSISPESSYYARACHVLSQLAGINGRSYDELYYLAMSAIADTRSAVREVISLQELGVKMSEIGQIDRAYTYLTTALTNAVECNASMRILQSSMALPLILQMHAEQQRIWQTKLYITIGILALVSVVTIIVLLMLYRQMKKMHQLKNRLETANHVKEVYISQFFRLCSIYIDRLNQFCKVANRKISSGQIDELYRITKSGKIVEEQSEEFYRLFDDAFLHIYPTFVKDVNDLLADKIVLKEGELLNNDLRILAFMRLGLEDTNQVATILNYSVNTIYAYRNKLRNRAYNRDTFEADIMRIGAM